MIFPATYFFQDVCSFELPQPGQFAVGNVVFNTPKKENQRDYCDRVFESNIKKRWEG